MTSLQSPGRQNSPEPFADLVAKIQAMQRELGDLTSSLLRSAGISVSPEGMTVDRALEVLGQMNVQGDLDVSGGAVFSGDMRIEGTLSLPAGIIDNEALANPIESRSNHNAATGFAWTTAEIDRAPVAITVPPGFTKATVTAVASAYAYNALANPSGYGWVRAYVQVSGTVWRYTAASTIRLDPDWAGSANALLVYTFDVTDGQTLTAWSRLSASHGLAAIPQHYADTVMHVLFHR